jgi:hypothetical protein
MATIGSATQTVTLSPSKPDVTLTGTIDAYGPAGAYISSLAAAAVFGAAPGKFTFTNAGTIISAGTGGGALAEGILFGGPGTVFNAGLIEAAGGIGMFSLGKGGLVDNASGGRILGTAGIGAYLQGEGTVINAGAIIEDVPAGGIVYADAAVGFGAGGVVDNSGMILGQNGIELRQPGANGIVVTNAASGYIGGVSTLAGVYEQALADGIYADQTATVSNAGVIYGGDNGILITSDATVENSGTIGADFHYGVDLFGGGLVRNTGSIDGIFIVGGTASVANAAGGVILHPHGEGIAVDAEYFRTIGVHLTFVYAAGTLDNAGLVAAQYGAEFIGIGGATNTGTILSQDTGLLVIGSQAAGLNRGFIDATGSEFSNIAGPITAAGIYLINGASFTNAATGTVSAPQGDGVLITGSGGAVSNAGSLIGDRQGIESGATASVSIFNAGEIVALGTSFTNAYGTVEATHGIRLSGAGNVTNASGGTVAGDGGIAIEGTQAGSYILNLGHVSAQARAGLYLLSAGRAVNGQTGTVTASAAAGMSLYGGGYAYNYGTVLAGKTGIFLKTGGYASNFGLLSASTAGIYVQSGQAGLYNINGATIAAYREGVQAESGAYLYNAGLIDATGNTFDNGSGTLVFSHGVLLKAGGSVSNGKTGTIIGEGGIFIEGGETGSYVLNAGRVTATGHAGIYLQAAGLVTNAKTGVIQASRSGVELYGGGTAVNVGGIDAGRGAVYLHGAGVVDNFGSAVGAVGLFATLGRVGLYNYAGGVLTGTTAGAEFFAAGYVYNAGVILGGDFGVVMNAGGAIYDSGTISAATAISFADDTDNLLMLSPKARTTGIVNGGSGALELLAHGKTEGTAAPSQFVNFDSVTIESKAIWDMAGTFVTSLGLTLVNDGTIEESAKDLIIISAGLSGKGVVDLSKQVFTLNGAVAKGETIAFTGTGQTLAVGDGAAFVGKIGGFAPGDTIELTGFADSGVTTHFAKGILTLENGGGEITLTFTSPASFGKDVFLLTQEGGGTAITLAKPKILAPAGTAGGTALPAVSAYAAIAAAATHDLTGVTMFVAPGWIAPATPRLGEVPVMTLHG